MVGHERGKKIRVVKFKPKRGYKRTTGHRSELTRIEITSISVGKRIVVVEEEDRGGRGWLIRRASAPAARPRLRQPSA